MKSITSFLKSKNDSLDFITEFVEKFGYPVWGNSVHISDGEQTTFFVPIKSELLSEIETIWLFKKKDNNLKYYIVQKTLKNRDVGWTFDYFTQRVLHKLPNSGLIFKNIEEKNIIYTRGSIRIEHCNEIWTGSGGELSYQYSHCWSSVHYYSDEDESEESMDDDSGGGGGGGGSACVDEIIPDKSLSDYPEVKIIYDCIITNADGFVKEWLSRFNGVAAPFNLTFKIGFIDGDINGHCDFTKDFKNGEIVLNKEKINRSSLEITRTLMHESMHAYMHAYVYSAFSGDAKYGISTFDEAFNKFEAMIKREHPNLTGDEEHRYMAENWVKKMTQELERLHQTQKLSYDEFWKEAGKYTGIGIQKKNLFYEVLAWEGLENTEAFKRRDSVKLAPYEMRKELLPKLQSGSETWICAD